MSYRAKAYPYPVLSPFSSDFGNDVQFELEVEPQILGEADLQQVRLQYAFGAHSSEWLDRYVQAQRADYILDIECGETRFREFWTPTALRGHRDFAPGELAGTVQVTPLIVATSDNAEYRPAGIDAEFGNQLFGIRRGDVLAYGHTLAFNVAFAASADRGLLTIKFTSDPDYHNNYRFELGGDRIIINAGDSLREPISRLQSLNAQLLYMGMFKDCIAAALEYLAEEGGWEDTSHPWGKTLIARIEEAGLDLSPDDEREKFETAAQRLVADRWINALAVLNG